MTDDRALPPLARVWNEGERHVPTVDPESKNHYRHMTAYHFALPLVRDRDVLDYGCGSGYGANLLWRRGGPRSLVAVDVSPDAIAYCRATYADIADHFRLATAGSVPAPEASVDTVLLFQTLEHVADDGALLRALARALRPGGVLLITTPNVAFSGGDADHPENVHHVREYERGSLLRLCHSVFPWVEVYGLRGSFRVGGGGLGPERILLYRVVRRMARRIGHRPYLAPVSLADFTIDANRLEEALDLLFLCRQTPAP